MKSAIVIITYIAIGFLTFGHVYNTALKNTEHCGPRPGEAFDNSVFAGIFWPIYFSGKIAIAVTK